MCKGLFCLNTFPKPFSAYIYLQKALLPTNVRKGLFCPYSMEYTLSYFNNLNCVVCLILAFVCLLREICALHELL